MTGSVYSSCLFVLVGSSLAKKVDLWTNLWGSWGVCVSEARLGNKMWRAEGCTPKRFSLLFVKKYSSSIIKIDGNCLTVGIPDHKKSNYYYKSNQKHLFFMPQESFLLTMSVNRKVDWLDLLIRVLLHGLCKYVIVLSLICTTKCDVLSCNLIVICFFVVFRARRRLNPPKTYPVHWRL